MVTPICRKNQLVESKSQEVLIIRWVKPQSKICGGVLECAGFAFSYLVYAKKLQMAQIPLTNKFKITSEDR